MINQIIKYERQFSKNLYNGHGRRNFCIIEGEIPVMISAPHAVNQFREGQEKYADRYTGGIAMYLQKMTGCHLIYSSRNKNNDPNYDPNPNGENQYQTQLKEYLDNHKIHVLIDLHGASVNREYALEMGTAPVRNEHGEIIGNPDPSLQGRAFICDLIKYTFDFYFRDIDRPIEKKRIWKNQIFDAGTQNTVTKYISENTNVSCVQLEINGIYRTPENSNEFSQLVNGLICLIKILSRIDWNATQIKAYRLWQASVHKPQDKVELDLNSENNTCFLGDSPLNICSFGGAEMVKIQNIDNALSNQVRDKLTESDTISEYLFLTNRLIELVCGREWIQDEEQKPFLRGAPIVLCKNVKEIYKIGMPKASQIDNVSFSTELFQEKKDLARDYHFVVYNRYTDSRFYIDFEKADYKDSGRVKDANGMPAKKVMIPRYYRRLLGYLDEPLLMIRKKEYEMLVSETMNDYITSFMQRIYTKKDEGSFYLLDKNLAKEKLYSVLIQSHIRIDKNNFLLETTKDNYNSLLKRIHVAIKDAFSMCYEKMKGEDFYVLRKDDDTILESIKVVSEILKMLGVYDNIELLQIPKKKKANMSLWRKLLSIIDRTYLRALNIIIGKSVYLLKTEWTSETDDKNNVARLSPNIMSLLGVVENDKVHIKFGEKKEELRVLANESFSDYQIGIPAPARKRLGMNSINDIVMVHRDMKHTFWRNSQAQIIAILGTILAVFQVSANIGFGILLCLIFIPLIMVLVLNEERIKVK